MRLVGSEARQLALLQFLITSKNYNLHAQLPWLRWWDLQGNLLLTGEERAEQESQRAEQERQRADRLTAQLRSLGVEPEV